MKKIIISLLIVLCANVANAAEWVRVDDKEFLDKSSVNFGKNNVTFWYKRLNSGISEPVNGKKVWYALARADINCLDATARITDIVIYGLKNEILLSDSNKYVEYEPIVPDSYTETYYKIFCRVH